MSESNDKDVAIFESVCSDYGSVDEIAGYREEIEKQTTERVLKNVSDALSCTNRKTVGHAGGDGAAMLRAFERVAFVLRGQESGT